MLPSINVLDPLELVCELLPKTGFARENKNNNMIKTKRLKNIMRNKYRTPLGKHIDLLF